MESLSNFGLLSGEYSFSIKGKDYIPIIRAYEYAKTHLAEKALKIEKHIFPQMHIIPYKDWVGPISYTIKGLDSAIVASANTLLDNVSCSYYPSSLIVNNGVSGVIYEIKNKILCRKYGDLPTFIISTEKTKESVKCTILEQRGDNPYVNETFKKQVTKAFKKDPLLFEEKMTNKGNKLYEIEEKNTLYLAKGIMCLEVKEGNLTAKNEKGEPLSTATLLDTFSEQIHVELAHNPSCVE